jgi:hypothetical protein
MKQEDDPVFTRPEAYGIENLEAPGEPDRAHQPPSSPVPGTGREARARHQQQHDARGATPRDDSYERRRDRRERQEAEQDEREVLDAEADPAS